ncbi:transglycosylase protein with SLT domain [Ureibacillus xyleni]|uniref:Transglycosylase protein with SLT domain n=1 Tax=Ureibacillus xyleni TaxID=614648 RepID=A0A285SJD9_9BACL|nr:lytic transglycosylase domain-containing protein [Ureibacillus xyleni]SOC06253.1 transglycosylase protein with SLT domain [Ureibacillus xyleni]
MAKKKKSKPLISPGVKLFLIIILLPASITIYFFAFLAWQELKSIPFISELVENEMDVIQQDLDLKIPEEYIPIYMSAEETYGVPWTLLAAHHRIETRFSTMKTLVSPLGAEGHMQFMPCTFVGWDHPTCNGLGQGEITEEEKTNPKIIRKYGGYGVDANKDGVADPFDIEDAIFSAANYLAKAGVSDGQLKKAIYNYNHSEEYVDDILYYYHLYEEVSDDLEQIILSSDESKTLNNVK